MVQMLAVQYSEAITGGWRDGLLELSRTGPEDVRSDEHGGVSNLISPMSEPVIQLGLVGVRVMPLTFARSSAETGLTAAKDGRDLAAAHTECHLEATSRRTASRRLKQLRFSGELR